MNNKIRIVLHFYSTDPNLKSIDDSVMDPLINHSIYYDISLLLQDVVGIFLDRGYDKVFEVIDLPQPSVVVMNKGVELDIKCDYALDRFVYLDIRRLEQTNHNDNPQKFFLSRITINGKDFFTTEDSIKFVKYYVNNGFEIGPDFKMEDLQVGKQLYDDMA